MVMVRTIEDARSWRHNKVADLLNNWRSWSQRNKESICLSWVNND